MPTAYGAEFRQDVIDVARKGEAPQAQIAKDFGLSVSGELKVSYAWSALGRRTVALQRKREELHPGVRLIWVQSNAPTGGLANGSVDVTIVRRTLNDNRFGSTLIGTEARYGALAKGQLYGAGEFLQVQAYTHVLRWTNEIAQRPAAKRGRMVNRTWGEPASQLHERHDASDFGTKTQDKVGS